MTYGFHSPAASRSVRRRATRPGGSSPPSTTTRPLRWRRAGTGRAGAAASTERGRRASAAERGRVAVAVGADLDQLEVVVAEAPEERLGALERPGVVEGVERRGGVVDQRGQIGEHRPVERLGGPRRRGRRPNAERELRRVEQLDGEAAADLHLASRRTRCRCRGGPMAAQ